MRPAGKGRAGTRWMCPDLICPWDPHQVAVTPLVRASSLLLPFP